MLLSPSFHGRHALSRTAWAALAVFSMLGAEVAFGHGELHERIGKLTAAVLAQPTNAALHFELALVLEAHGEWERALARLDRVDALASEKYPTDLVRGRAFAAGGDFRAARAQFDHFLADNPKHADALLARARVLSELGELPAAAADGRAAVALTAKPGADLLLQAANYEAAAGQEEAALAVLDAALRQHGALPVIVRRAVELECALGRFAAAGVRLDAQLAAASAETRPAALAAKARLLAAAGERTTAGKAWQALLDDLAARPPLERGAPALRTLAGEARQALGLPQPPPISPPAPTVSASLPTP